MIKFVCLLLLITPLCCFRLSPARSCKKTQISMVDPLISLGTGSISGVIGIGVAYPLDSLKTKAQTFASSRNNTTINTKINMLDMASIVYQEEGLKGFYSGVYGVMLGEAFVKATLFGSNAYALSILHPSSSIGDPPTILQLALAAAFSGVISSFVLNPIERVKVLMQADKTNQYTSEIDCIIKVLKNDGFFGFLTRGLDAMMAREIPGCTVYFLAYTLLKNSILNEWIGDFPCAFVSGAAAGIFAWIPIYPFDVIKTNMQNTQGSSNTKVNTDITTTTTTTTSADSTTTTTTTSADSTINTTIEKGFLQTAYELQQKYGLGVFYDGVQPKLLRAAVNHSVTFFMYNLIITYLSQSTS